VKQSNITAQLPVRIV